MKVEKRLQDIHNRLTNIEFMLAIINNKLDLEDIDDVGDEPAFDDFTIDTGVVSNRTVLDQNNTIKKGNCKTRFRGGVCV